jgi:hypothetical protein
MASFLEPSRKKIEAEGGYPPGKAAIALRIL